MDIKNFISDRKAGLIEALDKYISNELSHQEINDLAWENISLGVGIPKSAPYVVGEDVFWCTVWTIQHIADEEHMKIKSSMDELALLLGLLKSGGKLPDGWAGKRP